MTDSTATDHSPIPLLANSYNLQDLEKGAAHAEGLKTPDARSEAYAKLPRDAALQTDVLDGFDNPALPEGTELAEVEDAQGRTVTAPVAIAANPDAEAEDDTPATTTSTRRRTPPADSTPAE